MSTTCSRLAVLAVLVLTACAPAPSRADLLYLQGGDGLAAVNATTGQPLFHLANGVPSPDWSRLFMGLAQPGRTRLAEIDGASGAELRWTDIEGDVAPRVVSPSGRLVALVQPPRELGPGLVRSTLVVARMDGQGDARRFQLNGNYEPEAFSSDDGRLFVIEYLPAIEPDRYRVRQLDLATGAVGPINTRQKVAPRVEEEMRGASRMQRLSPNRRVLYTLYTHQPDHLHVRDIPENGGAGRNRPDVHAFVHVLDLDEGWAYCLDLPAPFGTGPATHHALAISPDGRRLFVADASSGAITVADTNSLQLVGRGRLPFLGGLENQSTAAMISRGLLYVSHGGELVALRSSSLEPERRWTFEERISGLATSPDGTRLYVGLDSRVVALDGETGEQVASVPAPAGAVLRHVGRSPSF